MLRVLKQFWANLLWFVVPPELQRPETEQSPLNAYDYAALAADEEKVVIEVKPPPKK
jgi:hypothetical protein